MPYSFAYKRQRAALSGSSILCSGVELDEELELVFTHYASVVRSREVLRQFTVR